MALVHIVTINCSKNFMDQMKPRKFFHKLVQLLSVFYLNIVSWHIYMYILYELYWSGTCCSTLIPQAPPILPSLT